VKLNGRVAIVTGSSRGIGKAVAEAFAAEGARVVICCRDQRDRADAIARSIGAGRALVVQADVSTPLGAAQIVGKALSTFGRLDVLVNNAGILFRDDPWLPDPERWSTTYDTNVVGAWLLIREAAEHLTRSVAGAVVNVSSIYGVVGSPAALSYSASKGAMLSMTTALARELAPRVRVNAVAPGNVMTEMTEESGPDSIAAFDRETLLRRSAQPHEVANAILFLASDDSSYVTGQCLVVDGGYGVR
jgi:NAD(P)-dependent dehydrogenase (short-subunit alcohol dehydrogenase family)